MGTNTIAGSLLVLAVLLTAPTLAAQDASPHGGPPDTGPALSAEHEFLQTLVGSWTVLVGGQPAGQATGRTRLAGQFVELRISATAGPVQEALYTFGFDARHGRFTVLAMDNTGTYWVAAQGDREGDRIPMYGADDDPVMAEMGLEKAFVIELAVDGPDAARVETRLIDTRTPERTELPFFAFDLRR